MNRLYELDMSLCLKMNLAGNYPNLITLFRTISRLADGLIWYCMAIALPLLFGERGLHATLHMATVAVPSLIVYKYLKRTTSRQRPSKVIAHIQQHGPTLDQFSFPSGHTLHAVVFALVVYFHFPASAWLLGPFALLVAISRPLLGLHYPSDVLAGAAIGIGIAMASIQFPFFNI